MLFKCHFLVMDLLGHGPLGDGPLGHGPLGHCPLGYGPDWSMANGHGPLGNGHGWSWTSCILASWSTKTSITAPHLKYEI